jgi:hypothetical protein
MSEVEEAEAKKRRKKREKAKKSQLEKLQRYGEKLKADREYNEAIHQRVREENGYVYGYEHRQASQGIFFDEPGTRAYESVTRRYRTQGCDSSTSACKDCCTVSGGKRTRRKKRRHSTRLHL